jgi:hypothetical protein
VSFADRDVSRSGAETGGGTASTLRAIGILAVNGSRCMPLGGGGTTVVVSAGAVRIAPCATCGGGATIVLVSDGAERVVP